MTDAPGRIWVDVHFMEAHTHQFEDFVTPYILAPPEALAASPEVQALIREAEARGMERAADDLDARARGLNLEISTLWAGSRAADRLKERRYECLLRRDVIRAEAAAIRETKP